MAKKVARPARISVKKEEPIRSLAWPLVAASVWEMRFGLFPILLLLLLPRMMNTFPPAGSISRPDFSLSPRWRRGSDRCNP
jgi:hypothetical protein